MNIQKYCDFSALSLNSVLRDFFLHFPYIKIWRFSYNLDTNFWLIKKFSLMRKFVELVSRDTSESNHFVHNSTLRVSDTITTYVLTEACVWVVASDNLSEDNLVWILCIYLTPVLPLCIWNFLECSRLLLGRSSLLFCRVKSIFSCGCL